MKRILPLFTIALVFAAMTSSAAEYYDIYANPTITQSTTYEKPDEWNTVPIYHETVNYGEYEVIRTSYVYNGLNSDSFYKIHINGNDVSIYLTDYINNDAISNSTNGNALTTKGINTIGYRYIASNDTTKVGTFSSHDLVADSDKSKDYTWGEDTKNGSKPTVIEVEEPGRYSNQHTVTRNQYYLGTFNEGDEIEIYMSNGSNEAWSNTAGYTGGYGGGVYESDRLAGFQLGLGWDWDATRKAVPLASLNIGNGSVVYGLYGESSGGTVGSPLPGGLPVVLVSGLFALGFWYFRRNKAVAV